VVASPAVDDGSTFLVADENLGRVKADAPSWRLPTRAAVSRRVDGESFMVSIQTLGAEQSRAIGFDLVFQWMEFFA